MSSSKSTVVGVRLDHDRRAWVEAEAGRRGITVRVLFEEFIDRARTGETDTPPRSLTDGETLSAVTPAPEFDAAPTGDGPRSAASSSRPWPCSEMARLPGLPGAAMRTALSITAALVRVGGGCVLHRTLRAGAESGAPWPPESRERA